VGDLQSAISSAFDEATGTPEPASNQSGGETHEPEARETTSEPAEGAEKAPEPAAAAPQAEEETGDVLFDRLTPEQIAHLKATPEGRALYKGLMQSYTQKMQKFSEQERLWNALNNPETQKQAVEALARSVGLDIKPTDQPQRAQAAAVADSISEEWSKVVGPEAAEQLRPLIEKTALAAVQGSLVPLQKAAEYVQQDAAMRQSEASIVQFRATAKEKGWEMSPQIEAKMAEIGKQIAPTRRNPITGALELAPFETSEQATQFLDRCYIIATADQREATIEKRILERMQKNQTSAEPTRGVPSTGREKRSNITKDMGLMEAMDVAFAEEGLSGR